MLEKDLSLLLTIEDIEEIRHRIEYLGMYIEDTDIDIENESIKLIINTNGVVDKINKEELENIFLDVDRESVLYDIESKIITKFPDLENN